MLASGTKPAADLGATQRGFCHEGMDTFATNEGRHVDPGQELRLYEE